MRLGRAGAIVGVVLVAGVSAACTSTVSGSASAASRASKSADATLQASDSAAAGGSTDSAGASASGAGVSNGTGNGSGGSGSSGGSGGGSGSGGTHSTPAPKATPKPTSVPTPSPKPEDNAAIVSFEGVAHCKSRTDKAGTVTLTWTSKGGAVDAWLLHSSTASTGGDGKTDGGVGPLPSKGSSTQPFSCSEDYDFYTLYVHGATSKSGETLLINNNV